MDRTLEIAQVILLELDAFQNNFQPQKSTLPPNGIGAKETIIANQMQFKLLSEPFVAYVKVEELNEGIDKDWKEKIYLVCRGYTPNKHMPFTNSASFLSYKSPVGKIASQEVGTEIEIPVPGRNRGYFKRVYVLEKDFFTPRKGQEWDAINNDFSIFDKKRLEESKKHEPSLRKLLETILKEADLHLEQEDESTRQRAEKKRQEEGRNLIKEIQSLEESILRKSLAETKKKEKKRVRVVEQIALRDQPILDASQDSSFRLPVASQIVLSGAPGTGKTTTLIKRLALHSTPEALAEEERSPLSEEQISRLYDARTNWVLFTPNELLKIYLKEALNKEWLPAPDESVKIWSNERIELARDVLKFLRTGRSGLFTRTSKEPLKAKNSAELLAYTKSFTDFYSALIAERIEEALNALFSTRIDLSLTSAQNLDLAQNFLDFVNGFENIRKKGGIGKGKIPSIERIFAWLEELLKLRGDHTKLLKEVDNTFERNLNNLITNRSEVIAEVIQLLQAGKSEEVDLSPDTFKVAAKRRLKEALMWAAESKVTKSSGENSRNQDVWNLILQSGDQKETKALNNDLKLIGQISLALEPIERLLRGYGNIINSIPEYYNDFRLHLLTMKKDCPLDKKFEQEIKDRKISDNEIDLLILIMLRNARRAFQRNPHYLSGESKDPLLERIKARYRTQVAIDEATDFSVIQLGCMFFLSHPAFTSVTLSGDLMQRITQYGLMDWSEIDVLSRDFQVKELEKSYRQSPKLLGIAAKLYNHIIGKKAPFRSAYSNADETPEPLRLRSADDEEISEWIVQRVLEIYEINNSRLPSLAIFVPEDKDIDRVYAMIAEPLNEHSIEVEGCPLGKILGAGSKVRIFSVEYIKGLEFEGVFFMNIDRVYEKNPDLVDKYLYVGLTRAATFLSVIYRTKFPTKIAFVEKDFQEGDWSSFIPQVSSNIFFIP